ncbi:hypothetical protein G5716_29395 [Bacillus pacificus]|nr:hypothetical protein [Bacillus pacificus]
MRNLIKSYCSEYNILPVSTTIEGALINRINHPIVYKWLKTYKSNATHQKIIDDIYKFENSSAYKATILRLVHDGKFDNLQTVRQWIGKINDINDPEIKGIFEKIQVIFNSKTSGWVTAFINYFFDNYINDRELTQAEKIDIFRKNFPEIYMIVTSIKTLNIK